MSFSTDLKDELCQKLPEEDCCCRAELTAILYYLGQVRTEPGREAIRLDTDNVVLARLVLRLIRQLYGIKAELEISKKAESRRTSRFRICISDEQEYLRILEDTSLGQPALFAKEIRSRECCGRAYIRGAFLASGSVSDPGRSYHFEIICREKAQAVFLQELLAPYEIAAGITVRKDKPVLYVKDSTAIVDVLNVMGAYQALMKMENIRIVKEMRNSANRQTNCDMANNVKMLRASRRQIEDIRLIGRKLGFENLPENLRQTAEARLEYPDASIQELGNYLDPPVGKSGVNHRLRKLAAIAEDLKN